MDEPKSRSEQLFERARKVLPGGVSRNAVLRHPHPYYVVRGHGCRVTDVEGVERIDFANNMASLIHGHAHPAIVAAVQEQIQRGTAFTFATAEEVDYAEYMCDRIGSFDMIRFVNSGTEAVMGCLKAARAYTGRPKIAKVEGAYHGLYDYAEVSQTSEPNNWGDSDRPRSVPVSAGTPAGALNDVVVIPFNDAPRALALLEEHRDDLACVLVDPLPHRIGMFPAKPDFVRALHGWCQAHGALLVFDEVITFRSEYGGAQEWYDVKPDLTALGKIIGGGFPVGAFGGRREIMEVLNPWGTKLLFPHSGTFSANPVTTVAGLAAMQIYHRGAVAKINALAERARAQVVEAITLADVPACVTGAGSMFRIHLKATPPIDYRTSYLDADETNRLRALLNEMMDRGIMMINSGSATLSTAHTQREIDMFSQALLESLRALRPSWESAVTAKVPAKK